MATKQTAAQEFLEGVRRMAPLTIAVLPVGMVFGAVAVTKGLSPLETTLMSALVFAGGSQFVAMDIWTHPASWTAVGLAALLVNVRHVLMGASIAGKMEAFGGAQKGISLLFLADEIWAMSEFRARETTLTPAWYAGVVGPFYLAWVLAGILGALLGSFVGDPAVIGIDFAFPTVFIVLVTGFWKGRETGIVLLASAVTALAVHHVVPGVWYIAAGAASGLLAAAYGGKSDGKTR
ncbi:MULTISPECIES: AzlC family ABC transporter permease [Alphaproteobacteria]|uniref:Branched-chain amino acid ABC transporter permease n=2 Tax=Alphaproteobacteria TaxID=28211 RepID=A0A512HGF3_9HYPH|nr:MULTISPECIES: AzlC family ABC transporter permease [Alphaproteobacteria]GEO84527.1 branched-chain amino acid ABC transporter permease [Ciceribacter naphthalenivorans]GLR22490.1 branched-chain amino acid ABC transporter permease [Ciceribacter naphthalenivorans]GLT05346.1 branched-chain amino acid ABC transporter permease [Sphingomonas psychrolutea]